MFYIGVDLGKLQDHSALGVIERPERLEENQWRIYNALAPLPMVLHVRQIERVPLGTPYPRVVEKIWGMARSRAMAGQCVVVVDATGVGTPVIDMLRAADLGCELTAVTITGGERPRSGSGRVSVPKKDLIASLQLSLEKRELKIARGMSEVRTLVRELMDVGTGRPREHDDLVMALALACWRARQPRIGYGPGVIPGMPG